MQFEECHIPGQNTFLNPHFYSAGALSTLNLLKQVTNINIKIDYHFIKNVDTQSSQNRGQSE
jgi:hypothetical protein